VTATTHECANCKALQPAVDMHEEPIVEDADFYDDSDWRWLCDDFDACQVRAGGVEPEDES
jgi:hypothetical protein